MAEYGGGYGYSDMGYGAGAGAPGGYDAGAGYGGSAGYDAAGSAGAGYGATGGYDAAVSGAFGSQSEAPRKTLDAQDFMLPVTIKQISQALASGADNPRIDGKELKIGHVRIVARIVEMEDNGSETKFVLDDSTGTIRTTLWLDSDGNEFISHRKSLWKVGSYVNVVGDVKTLGVSVQMIALDVRPVTDMNEITHHLLDAIYTHLRNTKGPLPPPPPRDGMKTAGGYGAAGSSGYGAAAAGYGAGAGYGAPGASGYGAGAVGGYGGMGATGAPGYDTSAGFAPTSVGGDLTAVQRQVLNAFQDGSTTEKGFSIDEVAAQLGASGVSASDVRVAAEALALEGHLYATVDEVHFKSTS